MIRWRNSVVGTFDIDESELSCARAHGHVVGKSAITVVVRAVALQYPASNEDALFLPAIREIRHCRVVYSANAERLLLLFDFFMYDSSTYVRTSHIVRYAIIIISIIVDDAEAK